MKRAVVYTLIGLGIAVISGFLGIQLGIRLAERHVMDQVPLRVPALPKGGWL